MIHYIYKIIFLKGTPKGRYYIGKRSTDKYDNWKEDPYTGSGNFCYNYFEKYGKVLGETYEKQCLEETDSFEENLKREAYWIGDLYKLDPLCMNMQPGGCGPTEHKTHPSYKIDQYTKDCVFVKTWDSLKEAAKATGSNEAAISGCISGRNPKRHLCNGYIWVKHGEPPINKKVIPYDGPVKVDQYTFDLDYVATYNTYADAAKAVNGNFQCIQSACDGKCESAYGYIWCRHNTAPKPKTSKKVYKRKVGQYTKDGQLLAVFETIKKAADSICVAHQNIQCCCCGKSKTAKGYVWKYID